VLANTPVLVVGGGAVAARKVKGLLLCEARVTVVSPELCPELRQLQQQQHCRWLARTYESADLVGVTLVFVCTSNEELNVRISQEAAQRRLLVNVADRPELCSFYLPSVLRRGMLSIAVSTEGSSPLTARRIREELEQHIDQGIEDYLALLQSWRTKLTTTLSAQKRQLFWEHATEGQVYELLKQGRAQEAEEVLDALYRELCRG
jgi:precorrin-2 dehydrogenase/sirohydrochlorin ferrochelatase